MQQQNNNFYMYIYLFFRALILLNTLKLQRRIINSTLHNNINRKSNGINILSITITNFISQSVNYIDTYTIF